MTPEERVQFDALVAEVKLLRAELLKSTQAHLATANAAAWLSIIVSDPEGSWHAKYESIISDAEAGVDLGLAVLEALEAPKTDAAPAAPAVQAPTRPPG